MPRRDLHRPSQASAVQATGLRGQVRRQRALDVMLGKLYDELDGAADAVVDVASDVAFDIDVDVAFDVEVAVAVAIAIAVAVGDAVDVAVNVDVDNIAVAATRWLVKVSSSSVPVLRLFKPPLSRIVFINE